MTYLLTNTSSSRVRLPLFVLLIAAVVIVGSSGCGSGGTGSTAPSSGFSIQSMFWSGSMMLAESGATGQACLSDSSGFIATVSSCFPPSNHAVQFLDWGPTGGDGKVFISTSVFPSNWDFLQGRSTHCNTTTEKPVSGVVQGQIVQILCQSFPSASIAPSSVAAGSQPSNLTIWGSGINNAYGPPQVMIYNEFGNVVATASATSIASDQSSLTIPMPDFTGVADGTYEVVVGIYDSTNTLQPVLGTSVQISGYAPPPPPPPDPPPPSDCGNNACPELIAS
jgi:hypothetical protein